jgi:hypothetical protein
MRQLQASKGGGGVGLIAYIYLNNSTIRILIPFDPSIPVKSRISLKAIKDDYEDRLYC